MTENKQITIYELLPLLRKGWVAMAEGGTWFWFPYKPTPAQGASFGVWIWGKENNPIYVLQNGFNIAPFDGDWKDSLMEVKNETETEKNEH